LTEHSQIRGRVVLVVIKEKYMKKIKLVEILNNPIKESSSGNAVITIGETIEEIDELNTTLHQAIFKYDKKDVSYVIAIARIIEKLKDKYKDVYDFE